MSCTQRTSPAVTHYCDLASFLLKPLKAVIKKTTKRMLIVAFFLGKDRYLAAEQPDLQFGHFGKQIRGNSKILAVQKFFAGLENPIGVMTAGNGVTIRPRP
jgi:hypothetical protein